MGRAVWWPPPRRTYLLRPHDGAGTGALAQCRQSSGDVVAFRARSFVFRRVHRHAGGSVCVAHPPAKGDNSTGCLAVHAAAAAGTTAPLLIRHRNTHRQRGLPRPEGGWTRAVLPVTGEFITLFVIHVSYVLSLPIVFCYAFLSPQTLWVVHQRSSCVFEFRLETRIRPYRPIKVFLLIKKNI